MSPETSKLELVYRARLVSYVTLRFESTDVGTLDATIGGLTKRLSESGGSIVGPVPLPTRVEGYVVKMESGVREYRVYTHKRLMTLVNPDATAIQKAASFNVPAGVDLTIREAKRTVEFSDG